MGLTGNSTYFEDFEVGQVTRHSRGKTMCEQDNVGITLMSLNTAQSHFNEHAMADSFGKRLQFGGVTIAMVVGLTMQDTGENALAELGMDKIRLRASVFHGDTLYAYTEVLGKNDSSSDGGEVLFRHWGVNQDDTVVFEGERRVLIKKRPE